MNELPERYLYSGAIGANASYDGKYGNSGIGLGYCGGIEPKSVVDRSETVADGFRFIVLMGAVVNHINGKELNCLEKRIVENLSDNSELPKTIDEIREKIDSAIFGEKKK